MRDVARAAHLGLGPGAHRRALGELFAPMTEVAATNPHAWFPRVWAPAELERPSADNRMVAYPYTKRLVAVMDVDLAAAVVVASPTAADRLGVPEEARVHFRGWAYATDPVYVAEHDDLWRSPAMPWVFEQALAAAGLGLEDVDLADLYSCFPSSVLFALDALGITPEHRLAPFTVTGGLPYAGGAGSSYMLSSMASMADQLRGGAGDVGLVSGVGMHFTKHAAGIMAREPGVVRQGPEHPGPAVRRPIVARHDGPATIAAYTVHHDRAGMASDAVLVCDVEGEGGARCYAASAEADVLSWLESGNRVGDVVRLDDGGEGVNCLTRVG
jgi:acetyl-CoA C-acetyltransferase